MALEGHHRTKGKQEQWIRQYRDIIRGPLIPLCIQRNNAIFQNVVLEKETLSLIMLMGKMQKIATQRKILKLCSIAGLTIHAYIKGTTGGRF